MPLANGSYGLTLVVDLHEVDPDLMNTQYMDEFFQALVEAIDMESVRTHHWIDEELDEAEEPWLAGISSVHFIKTSHIAVHAASKLGQVHIDVFSCKDFPSSTALGVCHAYWGGRLINYRTMERI
jgi:S-adenosylmethionine/arginine decarboxylase-like enzyme